MATCACHTATALGCSCCCGAGASIRCSPLRGEEDLVGVFSSFCAKGSWILDPRRGWAVAASSSIWPYTRQSVDSDQDLRLPGSESCLELKSVRDLRVLSAEGAPCLVWGADRRLPGGVERGADSSIAVDGEV